MLLVVVQTLMAYSPILFGQARYPKKPRSPNSVAHMRSRQAARGGEVYAKECAVCHGANLQGVSAPALTGTGFGRSHLDGSQLRAVVTQTMPLTAPGSLKADEYAAVMA
jgi:mono/diheme cytochrome c family protein